LDPVFAISSSSILLRLKLVSNSEVSSIIYSIIFDWLRLFILLSSWTECFFADSVFELLAALFMASLNFLLMIWLLFASFSLLAALEGLLVFGDLD